MPYLNKLLDNVLLQQKCFTKNYAEIKYIFLWEEKTIRLML